MTFFDKTICTLKRSQFRDSGLPSIKGFGELADLTVRKLREFEYKVAEEAWIITGNNQILLGAVDIVPRSMQGPSLKDIGYFTFSLRSSSNAKYALSFLTGARIDLLNGGHYFCFGESSAKKRQTSSLHAEDAIEQAISRFTRQTELINFAHLSMLNRRLTRHELYALPTIAADLGLMPTRSIEYVLRQLDTDTGHSAWCLWKSFEVAWQKLGAVDRYEFFKGFYPLLKKELELPEA